MTNSAERREDLIKELDQKFGHIFLTCTHYDEMLADFILAREQKQPATIPIYSTTDFVLKDGTAVAKQPAASEDDVKQLAKDLVNIKNTPNDYLGVYFPYKFEDIAANLIKLGYRKQSPEGKAVEFKDIARVLLFNGKDVRGGDKNKYAMWYESNLTHDELTEKLMAVINERSGE